MDVAGLELILSLARLVAFDLRRMFLRAKRGGQTGAFVEDSIMIFLQTGMICGPKESGTSIPGTHAANVVVAHACAGAALPDLTGFGGFYP